jgi:hypothetical protein
MQPTQALGSDGLKEGVKFDGGCEELRDDLTNRVDNN